MFRSFPYERSALTLPNKLLIWIKKFFTVNFKDRNAIRKMLEPFELGRVQSDNDDLEDEIYCAAKIYEFEEVSDVEQFLINFRCTFFPFCASDFPCREEISTIVCRRKLISITFFWIVYQNL